MPKSLPPYVHREKTRHKKVVWYFRRNEGPRTRIRSRYGTPAFETEYLAWMRGYAETAPREVGGAGTLGWLVDRYRDSADFPKNAGTRKWYDGVYREVVAKSGNEPVEAITPQVIFDSMDQRAKIAASSANRFRSAMHKLFKWGIKAHLVTTDPTLAVDPFEAKIAGYHVWTTAECAKFEAHWAVGTRQRLTYDIGRQTALRRSDIRLFGPQHVNDDGWFTVSTAKNGIEVTDELTPTLLRSLAATPLGTTTFVARENGEPYTVDGFGNWFRRATAAAGLTNCTLHGLRKVASVEWKEAGLSAGEMEGKGGWAAGSKLPAYYAKSADRRRMVTTGNEKLRQAKARTGDRRT